MDKCPICLNTNTLKETKRIDMTQGIYFVSCQLCGEFKIQEDETDYMYDLERDGIPRYVISGIIRNRFESGDDLMLTPTEIDKLRDATSLPSDDPYEKIDLLIQYIYKKTNQASDIITLITSNDYPILYLKDFNDFRWYIFKAKKLELIEVIRDDLDVNFSIECQLDLKGWRRIAELKKTEIKSDQAFVVMWFDEKLKEAWEKGFKPALKKTGFKPIKIDLVEHRSDLVLLLLVLSFLPCKLKAVA